MRPASPPLAMTKGQREILENLLKSGNSPQRVVIRAKALLLAAEGVANTAIAARLEVSPTTVVGWRARFEEDGVARLGRVRPGRGRKPSIPPEKVDEIVRATLQEKPPGETHWSCRTMAEAQGVSKDTVRRIWSARGLQPHRAQSLKLSNDKGFEAKLVDVVGFYLNPPDKFVALCMDEQSQTQALDRMEASLPMQRGRTGTLTHDYTGNAMATLFAALHVLTGVASGPCLPKHRKTELLPFLCTIDREVPKGLQVHVILDNCGTHTRANIVAWLQEHPRFYLHFIPTSSSWLNIVECWFRGLTGKTLRRGAFESVPDLVAAIETYMEVKSDHPKPFIWTATTEEILEKVRRGRVALKTIAC